MHVFNTIVINVSTESFIIVLRFIRIEDSRDDSALLNSALRNINEN